MKFVEDNILLDSRFANRDKKFYNSDNEENYKKNKNKIQKEYPNTDIIYNFNKQGYRTKNFEDLDNNFILIFGCSYTEGVGLQYNEIWCDLLCEKLKIDHLNLAKAATGPDIVYLNSVQYITNNFPKPKLVIIQWPNNNRKSFAYKDEYSNDIRLRSYTVNTYYEKLDTKWYLNRYCLETGEMVVNNYIHYTVTNSLWNNWKVPVFNWTWSGDFETEFSIKDLYVHNNKNNDVARDLQHDGPLIHKEVAEKIYQEVKKTSLF